MLTFKEAQALLRISRTSMYRFIEQKRLTPVPSSTALRKPRVLFRRSEVVALLGQQ
jgi:predicted DNA-binding transcriptional regulator AlpA